MFGIGFNLSFIWLQTLLIPSVRCNTGDYTLIQQLAAVECLITFDKLFYFDRPALVKRQFTNHHKQPAFSPM